MPPYGLGAGSVDASLNNYVALHYASRHMSWLHCMWGIGASLGPYIMGFALSGVQSWNMCYLYISMQMASAYVGTCFMPPVFGFIANHICVSLFPVYLLTILVFMASMHERMLPKVSESKDKDADF